MDPQPLSFTYDLRDMSRSMNTPTEVNLCDWDQLQKLHLRELRLAGTIDLSTASRLINFNGWLAIASFSLIVGKQFVTEPKGCHKVELSDESTVTITASLTCKNDFNALAMEMLELLRPMHERQQ
ncbi:hypothetical protein ACFST9_14360 [Hymenobacter monticola]|uniref:Uncharacterized protein n=1 Tax=Hymenobacter monticola TaxID=1705399 RepID=A0ABY4BCA7_9BACT|nr:hypothetical protein [Hymenobacter monticola]UOE36705.1 hypothetical protein MTP16_24770 [Hymenobacter monticola]